MRRLTLAVAVLHAACGDDGTTPPICDDARLPFRTELRCQDELRAQAARPLDAAVPGAITIKTIVDRAQDDRVTFQDTEAYPVHGRFAIEHLGWPPGAPFVDQYYAPTRRFLLGSVTYYEEPDVFAYELAPYDTASAEMIEAAFRHIRAASYFGPALVFHPSSEEQLARVAELPGDVGVITTEELLAGIAYQPLALGETYAQVRVLSAAALATTSVGPRELVVLDRLPAEASVVAPIVTEEVQTPLASSIVRAQQRATPVMGLRDAIARLTPLDGRWVRLTVRAFDWEVAEVTAAEADAWWQVHAPAPVAIPDPDYAVTGLLDIDDVSLADLAAVGGEAARHGELRDLGGMVRVRDALAIPVAAYRDFLIDHGFDTRIATMLADPAFRADPDVRAQALAALAADMLAAPIAPAALAAIDARLAQDFPATRMLFRPSTTAEDDAHPAGAGAYAARAGRVGDPVEPVDAAIKAVWAGAWSARAFAERDYLGIDHARVAMAVLVEPAGAGELAAGVAISANVYDPAPGGEDAFFVNAQLAGASVGDPDPGVTADALMSYYFHANQPATYYTRSSLAAGAPVLSRAAMYELGQALEAIRDHFAAAYDLPAGYGHLPMAVEWTLVDEGAAGPHVWIAGARPYPGRGP